MSGQVEVTLPNGPLGLELRPAVQSNNLSIGCHVKGWKNAPMVQDLVPGSKILSEDGVNSEILPFSEVVEKIRTSTSRTIVLQLPPNYTKTKKAEKETPSGMVNENINPNMMKLQHSVLNKPSHVTTDSIIAPYNISTSINNDKCEKVTLIESGKKIQVLEQQVQEAKKEVSVIKNERRGNEGQIMFLKYQLDKLKGKEIAIATDKSSVDNITQTDTSESVQWLMHWNKFKPTLDVIKDPSAASATQAITKVLGTSKSEKILSSKEIQMKKDLFTQERISFRLEMQLRTWVDSQINLQKTLAAQDSEKYFEVREEKMKEETYKMDSNVMEKSCVDVKAIAEEVMQDSPAMPIIVQRPLLSPENHSFKMKSNCVQSSLLASPVALLTTHNNTNPEIYCCTHSSSSCDRSHPCPETQNTPYNSPSIQQSAACQVSNCDGNDYAHTLHHCLRSPKVTPHATPTALVSSKKIHGTHSHDNAAVLSPQQYRAILSSQKKPPKDSVLSSGNERTVSTAFAPNAQTSIDRRDRVVSVLEINSICGTDSGGRYSNPYYNYVNSKKLPVSNYSQPLFERNATSQLSYASLSSSSSCEQRNIKSQALKDRMLKLKQESNKIRDDLKRFRSTMQEVREECTN